MTEYVILIDPDDNEIGTAEKMSVHTGEGRLHRAFSIFVFNRAGALMLQQRSVRKHHFGGLWSNTCCSHPRPGESVDSAGHRKLVQEMGFDTQLREVHGFVYKAKDPGSGLTEHEFDHVLYGSFEETPQPNPAEVDAWRWIHPDDLHREIQNAPEVFTPWFKLAVTQLVTAGQL